MDQHRNRKLELRRMLVQELHKVLEQHMVLVQELHMELVLVRSRKQQRRSTLQPSLHANERSNQLALERAHKPNHKLELVLHMELEQRRKLELLVHSSHSCDGTIQPKHWTRKQRHMQQPSKQPKYDAFESLQKQ